MFIKHGLSQTKVYRAWADMKERCQNERNRRYKDYGARGITVCSKWQTFEGFFADMGQPPTQKHSLDRINNNGNYDPGNCRWAKPKEQGSNRRTNKFYVINGERLTFSQAARIYGLNVQTITSRYRAGYRDKELVCKQSKRGKNQYA